MLKLMAILLIAGMGCAIGIAISKRFQQRIKQLLLCQSLLQQINAHLEYQKTPTRQLLQQLAESEQFHSLVFLKRCHEQLKLGESFSIAWTASLEQSKNELALKSADYEILEEISDVLGAYDAKVQTQAITLLSVRLKTQIEEAEEKYKTDGKLARTLGILGGIAAAILLL